MRSFSAFALLVCIVLAIVSASSALAQKSVCVPINTKNSTIDPNGIPASHLHLTNRGQGAINVVAVSLCSPISMESTLYPSCVGAPGYVIFNQQSSISKNCKSVFNTIVSRPTATEGGFTTIFGSTLNGEDDNQVSLTVLCSESAPAALVSRSGKFAVMSNKLGGNTTIIVAYSAAACGSKPPPPAPGPNTTATCQAFTRGRTLINPSSWRPAVLQLTAGFSEPETFAFSLCNGHPTDLPSWLPDCPRPGFITRYFLSNMTCRKATFDRMVSFTPGIEKLRIEYASTVIEDTENITAHAYVSISCGQDQKGLYSPTGTFERYIKNKTHLVVLYDLAHPDLCVTLPTTRPVPTLPTKPSFTRPSFTDPTRPTRETQRTRPTNWTKPSEPITRPSEPFTRPSGTQFTRPSEPFTRPTRETQFTKPNDSTKPSF